MELFLLQSSTDLQNGWLLQDRTVSIAKFCSNITSDYHYSIVMGIEKHHWSWFFKSFLISACTDIYPSQTADENWIQAEHYIINN